MKILNSIIALSVIASAMAFTGCSDDKDLVPLTKTEGTVGESSYSSLSFSWKKVDGARQYSYQLKETATNEIIVTEVTQATSVTFNDLKPSTDYTLTVLAYAIIGSDNTTSDPLVLTGRTGDIQAIPTPVVTMSREINSVIFEWEFVRSASSYTWQLLDSDGSVLQERETRSLDATIENLSTGSYTFCLVANTEEPGFKSSEPSETKFDFVRQRLELWTVSGAYTSELIGGAQWTTKMTAYDDNSYVMSGWYGEAGYDLEFTIDPEDADDMFKMSSTTYPYNEANGTYAVETGNDEVPVVYVTPGANKCAFSGTAGEGTVLLTVSDGEESAVDQFHWGLRIDDICGEWIMHTTCMADMEEYDEDYDDTRTITITKIDDTTVELPLPYYTDYYVQAKVDIVTGTLTIQPASGVGTYGFTFANYASQESPVVATVSKSQFTLNDWTYWLEYSGVWYQYTQGAGTVVFTRP